MLQYVSFCITYTFFSNCCLIALGLFLNVLIMLIKQLVLP